MSLIFNTNEVLLTRNLLKEYGNDKNTIYNLLEKISYSFNGSNTDIDTLNKVFKKEIVSTNIDDVESSFTSNDEVLKTIPVKYKVNIVNDEVYFFTKKNVYIVDKNIYGTIVNNSIVKHVSDCNEIELENTYGKSINNDCYILFTSLFYVYKHIPYYDIVDIGIDKNSSMKYIHIEVPYIYKDIILDKINYEDYFINTKFDNDIWIPKEYFDILFTIDITSISNNRIRNFVWYIREVCKDSDRTNSIVAKTCYKQISNRLSSEYNNLDMEQIYAIFPELENLGNFNNVPIMKLTLIGKDISISDDTEYELLNNILTKLKNDLNTL